MLIARYCGLSIPADNTTDAFLLDRKLTLKSIKLHNTQIVDAMLRALWMKSKGNQLDWCSFDLRFFLLSITNGVVQ